MKYAFCIGIALLAIYAWSEIQLAGDSPKAEREIKAAPDDNAMALPEGEEARWLEQLNHAVDERVSLLGNSIAFPTETGFVITPLSNITLQCDAAWGVQAIVHEETDISPGIEVHILSWLDDDYPELSVGERSPAARALSAKLCQQLYRSLNCLGECESTAALTNNEEVQ